MMKIGVEFTRGRRCPRRSPAAWSPRRAGFRVCCAVAGTSCVRRSAAPVCCAMHVDAEMLHTSSFVVTARRCRHAIAGRNACAACSAIREAAYNARSTTLPTPPARREGGDSDGREATTRHENDGAMRAACRVWRYAGRSVQRRRQPPLPLHLRLIVVMSSAIGAREKWLYMVAIDTSRHKAEQARQETRLRTAAR